ncbi:Glyoxalase/Bleomycin resistance protein/Dioxygenase superfamily protein [Grimontia celer]|uniref:Glyoxalase/Bleomycin resistance protein/Dioxygenase superfamily protein n=1 Tax=Grimontia celer TaxID=1796497 RepID=A0A128EZ36_9GAMM|nr:VOC family protein [Grimontia celer]CZF79390.1 Glyoxalase/Bleomycin resistance protein/Dioxygenase superfamily protein [Grimontia celer]
MIQVLAIDHIVLRTTKLEEMLRFYTEVLGCAVERETPPETGLTQLRAGNALIDIVVADSRLGKMGGGAPTQSDRNVDHFCLQIKAVTEQSILDLLDAHGIAHEDFASRYGAQGYGNSIYLEDPEGNVVELRCQLDQFNPAHPSQSSF